MVAAGGGLSAYSTLEQGKQQVKYAKIAQKQLNAEADATEQAGAYESREKRKEGQRMQASQIAQISANGGMISGSNLLVMADSAREVENDAIAISYNYKTQANELRNRGALGLYQARIDRRSSRIRAFADALGTAGSAALMYKSFNPSTSTPTPKADFYGRGGL